MDTLDLIVRSAWRKSSAVIGLTLEAATVSSLPGLSSLMDIIAALGGRRVVYWERVSAEGLVDLERGKGRSPSWHSSLMSEAEYPSVWSTIHCHSFLLTRMFWPLRSLRRAPSLPAASGRGMWIRLASLLLTASSSSSGRLLAPITKTEASDLLTPSICCRGDAGRGSERQKKRKGVWVCGCVCGGGIPL